MKQREALQVFDGRIVVSLFLLTCGCAAPPDSQPARAVDDSPTTLVLLTRGGCPNTATMRDNLEGALRSLAWPSNYEVVDLDTLPEGDARRGYPTPTLLFGRRDVFDLPEPEPPFPKPT